MRVLFLLLCFSQILSGSLVPRKIYVPWDKRGERDIFFTNAHQLAEMPLNHMGCVFEYVSAQEPLPELEEDALGILFWFSPDTDFTMKEAEKLVDWATKSVQAGKKLVMVGRSPFESDKFILPTTKLNAFFSLFGLRYVDEWVGDTYKVQLLKLKPSFVDFERSFPIILPGYNRLTPLDETVEEVLVAQKNYDESTNSVLISIGENASYCADGYGIHFLYELGATQRSWFINPFLFFRKAFDLPEFPIPDTTTLVGKRIYYSHIDGDGWNNETEIGEYPWGTISARVIREKIIETYPDMPVTVGPIGADIDLSWVGTEQSLEECRKVLALPNVETASHTFTHPFEWAFFQYYTGEKEYPFLPLYPSGSWMGQGIIARLKIWLRWDNPDVIEKEEVPESEKGIHENYDVPRAFALKPFDLNLEIEGSIEEINKYAPRDKPVTLYQWSGDCQPFPAAMRKLVELQIPNMNGGDTRFDKEFDSYAFVFPLGRQVGKYQQIYSSNTNENLYTDLWRSRFWGFRELPETFINTEHPIRIKPMNLYYHIYSGQKKPALEALISNIEFIRSQESCMIESGKYPSIVEGFYQAKIDKNGDLFTITDRKGLNTLRFDRASTKSVDFARSKGAIGQRYLQGNLYVALDPAAETIQVALKDNPDFPHESRDTFCLESSTWPIENVSIEGSRVSFDAAGYGKGIFVWHVKEEGEYLLKVDGAPIEVRSKSENRRVRFEIPGVTPVKMHVSVGLK